MPPQRLPHQVDVLPFPGEIKKDGAAQFDEANANCNEKECFQMSSSKNVVPEAKEALNRFKMEAANAVSYTHLDVYKRQS